MIKGTKENRHKRVRKKIFGTKKRPRLVVTRSLKHFSAQIVDDVAQKTLISANTYKMEKNKKLEMAAQLGNVIASKAVNIKIKEIVFDKGGSKYHGRVKAFADAARKGGLKF